MDNNWYLIHRKGGGDGGGRNLRPLSPQNGLSIVSSKPRNGGPEVSGGGHIFSTDADSMEKEMTQEDHTEGDQRPETDIL